MQLVNILKVLLLGAVMAFVTACSSMGGSNNDDSGSSAMGNAGTDAGTTYSTEDEARIQAQRIEDEKQAQAQNQLLKTTTFYFDFDQAVVRPDSRAALEAHAQHLTLNGGRAVLEGHADERGTREYNLALGERRAEAISRYLTVLGVRPEQLESVSYGEEKAVSIGHDESSWGLNRRVEIRYEN